MFLYNNNIYHIFNNHVVRLYVCILSNRMDLLVFILNMQINMQVCNNNSSGIVISIIDTVILPAG
jgi:hypothetical protein